MKKTILFLMMLACQSAVFAAGTTLVITFKDNTTAAYLLSEMPVVTFGETNMTIKSANATADYERADVVKFDFADESSGVGAAAADRTTFDYRNGMVHTDGTISVYQLNGRMVKSGRSQLSLNELPSGTYIIKTNSQTVKFVKH